jgi:hypothetical protein
VQPTPSSQATPTAGAWLQPVPAVQLSAVQVSVSSQFSISAVPEQLPAKHVRLL